MEFKKGSLVCVLLPRYKPIAFFCGVCQGTGYNGTGTCYQCHGDGVRNERMQTLIFGGVAKVTSIFTLNTITTYSVVYPRISLLHHPDPDPELVMELSKDKWKEAALNLDNLKEKITAQIPDMHAFPSYGEAMQNLDRCKANLINEGIRNHGGVVGVFDDNPPDSNERQRLVKQMKTESGDKLWYVEYRSRVQQFFRCPQCKGEHEKCGRCYDSGVIFEYIPQYILIGMVKVTGTQDKGQYINIEMSPTVYVDDQTQALITRNYWKNYEDNTDNREPKKGGCTWEHLFYTQEAAEEWLAKKNQAMLNQWCEDHGNALPVDRDGKVLESAKTRVFPKEVPIEPCLC